MLWDDIHFNVFCIIMYVNNWSRMLVVLKSCSVAHRKPLDHLGLLASSRPPILTWRWRKYIRDLFSNTLPGSQFLYLFYCSTLTCTELAYAVSNGEKGREGHFTKKNCFEELSKLSKQGHCHHNSHSSWTLDSWTFIKVAVHGSAGWYQHGHVPLSGFHATAI